MDMIDRGHVKKVCLHAFNAGAVPRKVSEEGGGGGGGRGREGRERIGREGGNVEREQGGREGGRQRMSEGQRVVVGGGDKGVGEEESVSLHGREWKRV